MRFVWAVGPSLPMQIKYRGGYGGRKTAFFVASGIDPNSTFLPYTYKCVNSVFAAMADAITARGYASGCGDHTQGLASGGINAPNQMTATTEVTNGTTWSSGGNLITPRGDHVISGTVSTALAASGRNTSEYFYTCEKYNGTAWSSHSTMDEYHGTGALVGDYNLAMIACGGHSLYTSNWLEKWTGAAWSRLSNALVPVRDTVGVGIPDYMMVCGGYTNSGDYTNAVMVYNGVSWAYGPSLIYYRRSPIGGGGTYMYYVAGGYNLNNNYILPVEMVRLLTFAPAIW